MSTAYADPNSDVAYTWADNTATDYDRVNDGVRDPSAANIASGDSCIAGNNDDSEIATFGCSEPSISGTVTQVLVKMYAVAGTGPISTDLGAYFGGSTRTASSKSVTSTVGWHTTTYSGLSIAAGSFFPCRINITPGAIGKGDSISVGGCYLEITYTAAGGTTHTLSVAENLAVFESPEMSKFKTVDYFRSLSNTMSFATALADIESQTIQSRSLSETIGISTDALTYYYITRLVSETIGFSTASAEEIQRVVSLLLSENLGIATGTPAWVLYPVQLRMISETLALATSVSRTTINNRLVTENLALSDSLKRLAISLRMLSSNLALNGTLAESNTTISRTITETLALSTSLTKTLAFHRTITSIIGLSDNEEHVIVFRRLVSDVVGLTDAVTRNVDSLRKISENLAVSEDVNQHVIRNRQVVETLALSTQAIRNAFYGLSVIEQLGLSDAASKQAILLRRLNDTVGAVDSVLRLAINARAVSENIGLATSLQRYQLALRKISESLGLSDSAGQPASFVFPDATWFLPTRSKAFKMSRKKAWTMPTRSKVFKLEAAV